MQPPPDRRNTVSFMRRGCPKKSLPKKRRSWHACCVSWRSHARALPRPMASGPGPHDGPGAEPRARSTKSCWPCAMRSAKRILEDVPQLVAQMERLQQVSLTRANLQTILVNPALSLFRPRLRLREQVRGRGLAERDAGSVDPSNRDQYRRLAPHPISQLLPLRRGERL